MIQLLQSSHEYKVLKNIPLITAVKVSYGTESTHDLQYPLKEQPLGGAWQGSLGSGITCHRNDNIIRVSLFGGIERWNGMVE